MIAHRVASCRCLARLGCDSYAYAMVANGFIDCVAEAGLEQRELALRRRVGPQLEDPVGGGGGFGGGDERCVVALPDEEPAGEDRRDEGGSGQDS